MRANQCCVCGAEMSEGDQVCAMCRGTDFHCVGETVPNSENADWVRTADRLPLNLENELVVIDGKITLGLYDHNCWFFYNEDKNEWQMDEYDRVTHWMPLPKLPEVEG